jgi:hypothetical protein
VTAGYIDTGLPAGRSYFGQSDKPLVETANVHHERWVMFTEAAVNLLKNIGFFTRKHPTSPPLRILQLVETVGVELRAITNLYFLHGGTGDSGRAWELRESVVLRKQYFSTCRR